MSALPLPGTAPAVSTPRPTHWCSAGGTLVGFAALLLTSFALWSGDQIKGAHHRIPDGHDVFARLWHDLFTAPGAASWDALLGFAQGYYQASNWLTAMLAGLAMTVTGVTARGEVAAFMLVSGSASAVTGVFLWRYLRDLVGLSAGGARLTLFVFWTNLVVLYSLLRPMTDAVVLACSMAGLYAITALLQRGPDRRLLALGFAALLLGAMSKVSFVILLCTAPTAFALRLLTAGSRDRVVAGTGRTALLWFAVPVLAWFAVLGGCSLLDTVGQQSEVLAKFRPYRNAYWLRTTLLVAGQGLWIAALFTFRGGRKIQEPAFLVPLVWMLGYAALFLFGGVPFLNRHFLPVVLGLVICSAPALQRWWESSLRTRLVPIAFLGFNLLLAGYLIARHTALGSALPKIGNLLRFAYG